jgi:hypothetical protein
MIIAGSHVRSFRAMPAAVRPIATAVSRALTFADRLLPIILRAVPLGGDAANHIYRARVE